MGSSKHLLLVIAGIRQLLQHLTLYIGYCYIATPLLSGLVSENDIARGLVILGTEMDLEEPVNLISSVPSQIGHLGKGRLLEDATFGL